MSRLEVVRSGALVHARIVTDRGPHLMSRALLADLDALFGAGLPDDAAVVITGAPGRAFVVGGDLNELRAMNAADAADLAVYGMRVFDRVAQCPRPVVAAVNGDALGAGFLLALACDVRVASTDARLGYPEIRVGLMPGTGGTDLLVRLAGLSIARALCLRGAPIAAGLAHQWGLVDEVCGSEAVESRAADCARELADLSPVAYAQAKAAAWAAATMPRDASRALESAAFVRCFQAPDFEQRIARFFASDRPARPRGGD